MKIFSGSLILILTLFILNSCGGKGTARKEQQPVTDSISVSDTGFTGIKKYKSGNALIKEVTFRNGVRDGLMKTFYQSGEVRQIFWYRNGLREDSSLWYYQEGQIFRLTPYKRDTIDGIQKQYYRTGQLKAKIGYSKGLRTTYFEEFSPAGKLIGGYPSLIVNTTDAYHSKGVYTVSLELSDKFAGVRYWQGDLSNGLFDSTLCKRIKIVQGTGIINLKKSQRSNMSHLGVIAEILTNFGNNYLVYKKIDLPYHDLN